MEPSGGLFSPELGLENAESKELARRVVCAVYPRYGNHWIWKLEAGKSVL